MEQAFRRYLSEIGRVGGLAKSKRKATASRLNARSGLRKTKYFAKSFSHSLICTEFTVKWPIIHKNGKTYNPDFWCDHLKCYIEVATSKPNISSSREKWRRAIQLGYPLRVYWWKGKEITKDILSQAIWLPSGLE